MFGKFFFTGTGLFLFFVCHLFSDSMWDYTHSKYSGGDIPVQGQWGALNCHDPKLFQDDDGTYYVYSTDASIGNRGRKGLQIRKSKDLLLWECLSDSALQDNWDQEWLEWVGFEDEDQASSWAPTLLKLNGLYYMLHGIITDRITKNYPTAAITLAIAESPEGPFYPAAVAAKKSKKIASVLKKLHVTYKSSVLVRYSMQDLDGCYNNGYFDVQTGEETDFISWLNGFGCIDPEFVTDIASGKLMEYEVDGKKCYAMTYGSWKGGIALLYLDINSLMPVSDSFGRVIGGGYGAAYEGAQVIYNSNTGFYYLFVSMGNLEKDYRVGVGRCKNIEGPYFDPSGKSMLLDGITSSMYHKIGGKIKGAFTLGENGTAFRSPGGQSIMRDIDGKILFACHSRTDFLPHWYFYLQVNQMFFNEEGWPILDQNEYVPIDDKKKSEITFEKLCGSYDVILTERGEKEDARCAVSKIIDIDKNGVISGSYSGKIELKEPCENGDRYVCFTLYELGGHELIGKFRGIVFFSYDWSENDSENAVKLSFSTLDSEKTGEYFFGNHR